MGGNLRKSPKFGWSETGEKGRRGRAWTRLPSSGSEGGGKSVKQGNNKPAKNHRYDENTIDKKK